MLKFFLILGQKATVTFWITLKVCRGGAPVSYFFFISLCGCLCVWWLPLFTSPITSILKEMQKWQSTFLFYVSIFTCKGNPSMKEKRILRNDTCIRILYQCGFFRISPSRFVYLQIKKDEIYIYIYTRTFHLFKFQIQY